VTEAGWQQDPQDPTRLRYWDGQAWTEHVAASTGPPPTPAKSRTGLVVGIVVACVAGLVLLLVVGIVAVQFLGTSAKAKFSSVGSAIADDPYPAVPLPSTTVPDPGPFTAVMRTVLSLDPRPCTGGAISDLDGTACVRTSAESVPLKGLAGAVPAGDKWNVEVSFKADTSAALDRLMAACAPTPKGTCPLGRLVIVRVGQTETAITAPLVTISSFKGHAVFTGFTEAKAKLLVEMINNTK
jgi:hypothetical protein